MVVKKSLSFQHYPSSTANSSMMLIISKIKLGLILLFLFFFGLNGIAQRAFAQGSSGNLQQSQKIQSDFKLITTSMFDKYKGTILFKDINGVLAQEEVAIGFILEALEDFKAKNLEKFDATAGDTSCQIRSHKILALDHDDQFVQNVPCLLENLQETLQSIKKAQASFEIIYSGKKDKVLQFQKEVEEIVAASKSQKPSYVEGVFKKLGIEYPPITNDVVFMTLTHLVTKYHSANRDFQKMKEKILKLSESGGSSNFILRMVIDGRTKLNEMTTDYIKSLGDHVQETCEATDNPYQVTDTQKKDIASFNKLLEEVVEFPPFISRSAYAGFAMILADLWEKDIPLMFKMIVLCPEHGLHKFDYFYVKGKKPFEFVPFQGNPETFMDKSVYVLEGVSDLMGRDRKPEERYLYNLLKEMGTIHDDHGGFHDHTTCPRVTKLMEEVNQKGMYEMSMANLAKHPQYVAKDREKINFNLIADSEEASRQTALHAKYCDEALSEGYCIENMTRVRLIHIFPTVARKAVGKVRIEADRELESELTENLAKLEAEKADREEKEKQDPLSKNKDKKRK